MLILAYTSNIIITFNCKQKLLSCLYCSTAFFSALKKLQGIYLDI